jgi:hypothetical protein
VWNCQHYTVLYYDIYKRSVTVFDGLNQDIRKWQDHIIHTVKTYGLKPPFLSATCKFRNEVYVNERVSRKRTKLERRDMALEISFDDLKEEPWHVQNKQSYVQGDGVNCGPIACLKLMEIYGFLPVGSIETIGESARGYQRVVMDYYNECVSRYNHVLKVEIHTKKFLHGKQPQSVEYPIEAHTVEAHEAREPVEITGLNFAPKCDNFCFSRTTVCDHIKNNVLINNLGDYVVFPSNCFHQGYYNSDSDMVYVKAQLFARPTIRIDCDQLTRLHTKQLDFIQNNLNNDAVTALTELEYYLLP